MEISQFAQANPGWMVAILFGIELLLMFLGMPIAYALGISAVIVMVIMGIPLSVVAIKMVTGIDSFLWVAVPLFLIMGFLMDDTGVTERLVNFCNACVGRVPGALSHSAVVTETLMSGITGSIVADAAAMGSVFFPAMKKAGYTKGYMAFLIASSATIGPLIPPSIILLLVANWADISVLRLWLAGTVPGLLVGVGLIFTGWLICRKRQFGGTQPFSWKVLGKTVIPVLPAIVIPIILLGGMRLGIFTPTEAGAVGSVYLFVIGLVIYRKMSLLKVMKALWLSAEPTVSVLFIIASASLYTYLLSTLRAGPWVVELLTSLTTSPTIFFIIVVSFLFFLGMVIDNVPMIVIFIPLLMPASAAYGIDPIHFAMVFGLCCILGQLTPPVAITLLLSCSMAEVSVGEAVKEGWPFLVVVIVVTVLTIFFPHIAVWFPNLIMGVPK